MCFLGHGTGLRSVNSTTSDIANDWGAWVLVVASGALLHYLRMGNCAVQASDYTHSTVTVKPVLSARAIRRVGATCTRDVIFPRILSSFPGLVKA